MDVSNYIDYTLLKPSTTEREIIELCKDAKINGFFSVCVNSCYVALAKQLLLESKVKVCTVVGFPLGAMSTKSKVFEAEKAIEDGADEIDMVINLGYLKSRNYVSVLKDISDVKRAIGKTPLKVIIEISELNKNEIIKACEICLDAKADFIKTSTGFSKSGATLTAVKIIKKTVRDKAKIKASGGIGDFDTALKYIDAGADRIGTSTAIKAKNDKRQIRNTKIYKDYIETVLNKDSNPINKVSKEV
ncbi:deoxyribose-phosphate aldolase [Algibacter marinivivus]|uniref:Deoxyribose-phosphate aldolase n=1 Tax=Algibacter marinivivus TaxID=2100723 RepID=A0A2U2X2G2_9FLAO|nr:deoxyribose-phosphate aldolase [Algibacter marinivivus]PWH81978.1 deoxyribose-phosphate aldolase [Algibacter marinivivus]